MPYKCRSLQAPHGYWHYFHSFTIFDYHHHSTGMDRKQFILGSAGLAGILLFAPSALATHFRDQTKPRISVRVPSLMATTGHIELLLTRASTVSLRIVNLNGKIVAPPLHWKLSAGPHTLPLERDTIPTGIYLYTMEVDGGAYRTSGKVVMT